MMPKTSVQIARERTARHMDGSDGMPNRPEKVEFMPYGTTGKPEGATHVPEFTHAYVDTSTGGPHGYGPVDTSDATAAVVNKWKIQHDPEWGLSQAQRNQAAWAREQKKSDEVADQNPSSMNVVSRKK